jgi:hypothetical protein
MPLSFARESGKKEREEKKWDCGTGREEGRTGGGREGLRGIGEEGKQMKGRERFGRRKGCLWGEKAKFS